MQRVTTVVWTVLSLSLLCGTSSRGNDALQALADEPAASAGLDRVSSPAAAELDLLLAELAALSEEDEADEQTPDAGAEPAQTEPAVEEELTPAPFPKELVQPKLVTGDAETSSTPAKPTSPDPPGATAVPEARTPPVSTAPAEKPLSPELEELRVRMRDVLDVYYRRQLNTRDNNHWELMHAVVAYGIHTTARMNAPDGTPVNAIAWICANRPARGEQMFYADGSGLKARQGPNVQGHHGQLLAILAQGRVDRTYPILAQNRRFTIEDLIKSEQSGCESGTELTFKLLGLMYYLDSNAEWKSANGQTWNLPRLIREEMRQPIRIFNVTCGGTHRLMAISYAYKVREQRRQPLDGEYLKAKEYVKQYQRYAISMQNPDGSLSTEWFRGPGDRNDVARKLQTTGHIFEWLAYSIEDQSLTDPRIVASARFLTDALLAGRTRPWNIGHMGHAVHALALYEQRLSHGQRYIPADAPTLARREMPLDKHPVELPHNGPVPKNTQPETPSASSADSEFDLFTR